MYRFILSLSKITYQMQRDHPLSQRNMTTEKTMGTGAGGGREVGGVGGGVEGGAWTKLKKEWGVGGGGVFIK